jgi:hypothetical protein
VSSKITIENGRWVPWRHPMYRDPPHEPHGWWERLHTGQHVAVLRVTENAAGNEVVQAGIYNTNSGHRGAGFTMGVSRFLDEHRRLPTEFEPPASPSGA